MDPGRAGTIPDSTRPDKTRRELYSTRLDSTCAERRALLHGQPARLSRMDVGVPGRAGASDVEPEAADEFHEKEEELEGEVVRWR